MDSGMNNTILSDVRLFIGLNPDEVEETFDLQIVSAINNAIAELAMLGVKNVGDFTVIKGDETWEDFLGEEFSFVFAFVKNYVELSAMMLFDPPQGGTLSSAREEQLRKATFNVQTAIEHHNILSEEDKS